MTTRLENAGTLLSEFVPEPGSPRSETVQKAVFLARTLQQRASVLQTPQEAAQQEELDRMIHNPKDKSTLVQMTDQAFRAHEPDRAVEQLIHILDVQGIPGFFGPLERTMLKGFQTFGSYLPSAAASMVKDRIEHETSNVILPAEREILSSHLRTRNAEGIRMNVNFLGEAILGEKEAERRLKHYLVSLHLPDIEVVSIKISTIFSQINPIAREHTIEVLCDRLELLYRTATRMRFQRPDGTEVPKFVYLDMEEYRDMSLTSEAFMRTLDRPGLKHANAGIALQAYIPDSYAVQKRINRWAKGRVANGGSPVTIRVVKGANMEMERVHASQMGWPQATFKRKSETDANFKRMVQEGMQPQELNSVHLGIASHNLFDLAYGLVMAAERHALNRVQFEMLEGMANNQRRALFELTRNVLLYAPACRKVDFINAIGYLIRRLDENTGPANFLRHAFKLSVDSEEWRTLEQDFVESFDWIQDLPESPRQTQDRNLAESPKPYSPTPWTRFVNEPNTDFSLPHNSDWAERLVTEAKSKYENPLEIPVVIAGEEIHDQREIVECADPSREGVVVGRSRIATRADIERAVESAKQDEAGWRKRSVEERFQLLSGVANELRSSRGALIGAALADGGKTIPESDPEVSEAIDFVEFYVATTRYFSELEGLDASPKGVVAVVPPWNFPIAIPCGGIAAALATGNTVILKPALETVVSAYTLCECFWRAGIPKPALQFAPSKEGDGATRLVEHPDVDTVILTGATETAQAFLELRPEMNLLAETGGKNAMIVTALSDRDLAIKNIVQSAFSHCGQKCSATSLVILEAEVYEDVEFRRILCEAVESLPVGSAWDLTVRLGPLIHQPNEELERGLKELDAGESWEVLPKRLNAQANLYSPGVKWGVAPGSFTHLTELFGPVLGVMKAEDLKHAVELVNQTGYGLTSGLQSLDDREQEYWKENIQAGNLYINRTTVGAIVLRQPFGGFGKSAFGPGIKAGGPNYVAQLMDFSENVAPSQGPHVSNLELSSLCEKLFGEEDTGFYVSQQDADRLLAAVTSYDHHYREEFGETHDHLQLIGQDNLQRYVPMNRLRIRIDPADSFFDIISRVCAAKTVGCSINLSFPTEAKEPHRMSLDLLREVTEPWLTEVEFTEETDNELVAVIRDGGTDRIRYAAPERVPSSVRLAASKSGIFIAAAPVLAQGRVELLWYLREQSLCIDYHRYGNLGSRTDEERADTL